MLSLSLFEFFFEKTETHVSTDPPKDPCRLVVDLGIDRRIASEMSRLRRTVLRLDRSSLF